MIRIAKKIVGWMFPEHVVHRELLAEMREELNRLAERNKEWEERDTKLEQRIEQLERRFEKESCMRLDCKHRLTINSLPTSAIGNSGAGR